MQSNITLTQQQRDILECISSRNILHGQIFDCDSLPDLYGFHILQEALTHLIEQALILELNESAPLKNDELRASVSIDVLDEFKLTDFGKGYLAGVQQIEHSQATQRQNPTTRKPSSATQIPMFISTDAQIKELIESRPGQAKFHNDLIQWYGKCLVTECPIEACLEAAHIQAYDEGQIQDADNGLLLRADIHKLFDANLLGFEPIASHKISVVLDSSLLRTEYKDYKGKLFDFGSDHYPKTKYLKARYEKFRAMAKLD